MLRKSLFERRIPCLTYIGDRTSRTRDMIHKRLTQPVISQSVLGAYQQLSNDVGRFKVGRYSILLKHPSHLFWNPFHICYNPQITCLPLYGLLWLHRGILNIGSHILGFIQITILWNRYIIYHSIGTTFHMYGILVSSLLIPADLTHCLLLYTYRKLYDDLWHL